MLAALLWAVAIVTGASLAGAQQPPTTPPAPARDTIPRDTLARDSTGAVVTPGGVAVPDSAAADTTERELVTWEPGDPVFDELLRRQGYAITRYQGDTVVFHASTRRISLDGAPAAVQQDEALIVGDSIVFDDSTGIVTVRRGSGGPVVLRDPAQGKDIIANTIRYNIRTSQGTVSDVSTSTAIEGGEEWFVSAQRAAVAAPPRGDSTGTTRFYGHDGTITSCSLTEPHYHFEASNMKVVKGSIMAARPAVLYIGEVPVLWLPFIVQDMRTGRRSGLLTPRLGPAELVRNNSDYQRSVENVGYYFALSDYMSASTWIDWHSGARETSRGPGLIRYNGELEYKWLDRFIDGRIATGYEAWRDGRRNLTLAWNHRQSFSQRTSFNANVNYARSTILQQRGAFNPAAALGTITSNVNFQTKRGPFSIGLGANRTQYTGQEKVDMSLPTLNISSQPIDVGEWLTWTPTLSVRNTLNQKLPVVGELGYFYRPGPDGVLGDTLRYDRRTTTMEFATPLRIFGFEWQNSFSVEDLENNGPVRATVFNPANPADSSVRVFASEYRTRVDWRTSINLPSAFQGTWNLSPSIGIEDVNPGTGFLVRSYLSGDRWVRQTKRVRGSLSVSPTFFRQYGGVGPFAGFLHGVQTSLSYAFAPGATVSDDYLQAVGLNPSTYLGSKMQSAVTFNLNTYIEAKLRSGNTVRADTSADSVAGPRVAQGGDEKKLRLLSLNFTPISYDFVRADSLGSSRGWTTETFTYSAQSDLLPGFNLSVNYSLFNGPSSDTRSEFKPYRTGVNASFSLGRESNVLSLLSRLVGRGTPMIDPDEARRAELRADSVAAASSRPPVAGSRARLPVQEIQSGQGWRATLSYSSNRTRPDLLGTVIQFDPTAQCEQLRSPATMPSYEMCVDYVSRNPPPQDSLNQQGNVRVIMPAQASVNSEISFDLTPKWTASWRTSYDFTRNEFASHSVSLQRDLHDWRAIFAFNQAQNGNFAFNFYISLKAAPEIKFDYDRQSYRGRGALR